MKTQPSQGEVKATSAETKTSHSVVGGLSAICAVFALGAAIFFIYLMTSEISGSGLDILGMLSIGGMVICSPIALILGIIGLFLKNRKKLFAVIGVSLSGLMILLPVVLIIVLRLMSKGSDSKDFSTPELPSILPTSLTQPPTPLRPEKLFLTNPSFEEDPRSTPPYWQFDDRGSDAVGEWSTEAALSGEHSLSIQTSTAGNEQRGWAGWSSGMFAREASDGYRLLVKYYTPDGASPWIVINFYDSQGKYLSGMGPGCIRPQVLSVWQPLSLDVDAASIPAGTSQIGIELLQCLSFTEGTLTTLYYDDIVMRALRP